MVTFTLPESFRRLVFAHQRIGYDAMLRCAWQTIKQFVRNDCWAVTLLSNRKTIATIPLQSVGGITL